MASLVVRRHRCKNFFLPFPSLLDPSLPWHRQIEAKLFLPSPLYCLLPSQKSFPAIPRRIPNTAPPPQPPRPAPSYAPKKPTKKEGGQTLSSVSGPLVKWAASSKVSWRKVVLLQKDRCNIFFGTFMQCGHKFQERRLLAALTDREVYIAPRPPPPPPIAFSCHGRRPPLCENEPRPIDKNSGWREEFPERGALPPPQSRRRGMSDIASSRPLPFLHRPFACV